jgi:hypothetical protein
MYESPWKCWRLLTLETRMESCRRNSRQASRRHAGTARRRRHPRCGWSGPCGKSWAPITERFSGWLANSGTASSRCGPGSAGPISTTDIHPVCRHGVAARQGSRAGDTRTQACQRDSEASGEFLRGGARPPTQEVVAFIDARRGEFGVEPICTILRSAGVHVAPSTYYANKVRPLCARTCRDAVVGRRSIR